MIRLMVMNGLLICLILIWTSSASEPPKELRPEDRAEAQSRSNDDSQNISKKPNAYAFSSFISAEEDDIDIDNFNIINPHLGNEHIITRYGNHTFTRARGVDQKESVLNSPIRELKSGSQLLFFSAGKLSWIDAQKDCKARNGALAVLGDEPEDVFAYISENIGRKYFWLGGSDIKEEGTWLWLNGDPIDPAKYWRRGEPNGGESDDCLYLYRGIYYDRSCKREYQYICDLESDDNIPFHERTQYLSFSDDSLSWVDAKANCEAKQGTLAILEDEPDDVFAHIASHYAGITYWLGGSDIAKEGDWLWLNGNPIDLTKYWRRNEPNNWWGGEDCLQYYYGYNDRSCRRRYRYICDLGAPSTAAPTTAAPTTEAPTTAAPTTTAPSITHTNATSCSLVWNYEEDRPLIMIRETKTIVPPITDIAISNDPNRIPEGKKLIFACPGENNQFNHVQGIHTKLHGECISPDLFKVCVNNNPEIMDLSQLSCSRQMSPSIIKQDNETIYKKSCDGVGGELYKFGYIYGDYKEFKDLEAKICFNEEDQTTLWTSTNVNRIEISSSMQYKDPSNFRTARGFAMNTIYIQNSQQKILKEVLDNEAISVWNDKACRRHGGHCVRGGKLCPNHLPYQTSQGKLLCSSFYRCCYLEPCEPAACTHKGQTGNCSLDSLPGTINVGSRECKKGCQCYIMDNTQKDQGNKETLHQLKNLKEREELSKLLKGGTCGGGGGGGATFCELKELLSQNRKVSPMARIGECNLKWDERFGFGPLFVDHHKTILGLSVANGEQIFVACPGIGNAFMTYGQGPYIQLICNAGVLYHPGQQDMPALELESFGCVSKIQPTVIPFMLNPNQPQSQSCSQANDENWKMYQIGFKVSDCIGGFVKMIDLCFDEIYKTTKWTQHKLQGEFIHGRVGNSKTPDFNTNGFEDLEMYSIYSQKKQYDLYLYELHRTDILCNAGNTQMYLAKGHMAPKSDFVSKLEQDATYFFMNVLPQWQVINNGNWRLIEKGIQKYAKDNGRELKITTGGIDVLQLRHQINPMNLENINLGKYYIYDDSNVVIGFENTLTVPAPAATWKVMYDAIVNKGIAFLVLNDPLEGNWNPNPKIATVCTIDCTLIMWLKPVTSSPEDFRNKLENPVRGLVYCCPIAEFNRLVCPTGVNCPSYI